MRQFTDYQGRDWQVTVGKASYGALCLLFCASDGADWRRTWLAAETAFEAEGELARCTETDLQAHLESGDCWNPATGN